MSRKSSSLLGTEEQQEWTKTRGLNYAAQTIGVIAVVNMIFGILNAISTSDSNPYIYNPLLPAITTLVMAVAYIGIIVISYTVKHGDHMSLMHAVCAVRKHLYISAMLSVVNTILWFIYYGALDSSDSNVFNVTEHFISNPINYVMQKELNIVLLVTNMSIVASGIGAIYALEEHRTKPSKQ